MCDRTVPSNPMIGLAASLGFPTRGTKGHELKNDAHNFTLTDWRVSNVIGEWQEAKGNLRSVKIEKVFSSIGILDHSCAADKHVKHGTHEDHPARRHDSKQRVRWCAAR